MSNFTACIDCKKRRVGCQGECEYYRRCKKLLTRQTEERRRAESAQAEAAAVLAAGRRKCERNMQRKYGGSL